jgi:hypothetical protein
MQPRLSSRKIELAAAVLIGIAGCSSAPRGGGAGPDDSPPEPDAGGESLTGGTGAASGAGGRGGGGASGAGGGGASRDAGAAGGAGGREEGPGADGGMVSPPTPDAAAEPPGGGITDGLTQRLVSRGIGMGYYHLCVITPEKSVRCFGDKANAGDPRINPPAGIKPDQLHGAHNGFCFILPPGGAERVRCWGHNPSSFPRNGVTRDTDPIQVGHGYDFGCVLNSDNTVKCWGSQEAVKYHAPAGLKAKALTVAAYFTCAIKLDDTAVCWGIEPPNPPDPTLKMKLLAAVYHGNNKLRDNPGGENHACAILMDDTVKCWGKEVQGNLTPPADLGKVKDLAVATTDSCAVKLDGDVVCWGSSHYGGDSPTRYHKQPAGIKAKAIRAGMGTYCALELDDTLACWGDEQHDHISFPPEMKVYAP